MDKRILDITGESFGRLYVVRYSHSKKQAYWECVCECGKIVTVRGGHLRHGQTISCGCYCREQIIKSTRKHGMINTITYSSWHSMKGRCNNPNATGYKNYGGKGIVVCERWKNSFENFLEDMGERPPNTSLDRIDPTRDYEPGNCRWATSSVQSWNKSGKRELSTNMNGILSFGC